MDKKKYRCYTKIICVLVTVLSVLILMVVGLCLLHFLYSLNVIQYVCVLTCSITIYSIIIFILFDYNGSPQSLNRVGKQLQEVSFVADSNPQNSHTY